MSVINPANETRIENIGNTHITFEKISNQWMVSSLEIHRIFKSETTMKHGTMIKQFKDKSEAVWESFVTGKQIVTHATTAGNGNGYEIYYFDLISLEYFVSNMRRGTKDKDSLLQLIYKMQSRKTVFEELPRPEISFRDDLKTMLDAMRIECVFEYSVPPYRVDVYIPKYNLLVEYDERFHEISTHVSKDKERETYILSKTNGEFIRCGIDDLNAHNMGTIANRIISIALHGR